MPQKRVGFFLRVYILKYIAFKRKRKRLNSPAYAEEGNLSVVCKTRYEQFKFITFGIDSTKTLLRFFADKQRIYISPARKNESVYSRKSIENSLHIIGRRYNERHSPCLFHAFIIRFGKFLCIVVAISRDSHNRALLYIGKRGIDTAICAVYIKCGGITKAYSFHLLLFIEFISPLRVTRKPPALHALLLFEEFLDCPKSRKGKNSKDRAYHDIFNKYSSNESSYAGNQINPPRARTEIVFCFNDYRVKNSDYNKCRDAYQQAFKVQRHLRAGFDWFEILV